MYRIVIDCELGKNREKAKELVKDFIEKLKGVANTYENDEFGGLQYRLQLDSDRTPKNHMIENENGHVGVKKAKLFGGELVD